MGFSPRRTSSNFERITFQLGENTMALKKVKAFWSEPSEWKPDGSLTFFCIWEDSDGDEFTEFPSAPKDFGYNEKSTFWNRIAALAGKTGFEDDDLAKIDLEIPGMENYEEKDGDPVKFFVTNELQDEHGNYLKDENGKNIKVDIGVSYDGANLIGKQCRLVMGERRNKKGELQDGNKVAQNGALPLATGGGKKKSGASAPAPVAAAAMP